MRKFNLYNSVKSFVTNSVRLLGKAMRSYEKAARKKSKVKVKRPKTEGQSVIDEYKKRIEELEKKNKELEELLRAKTPVIPEEIIPKGLDFTEDDLPYEIKDEEPTPPTSEKEPEDYQDLTYKNFGSDESLDILMDFLSDTNLSGVSPDSPFFDMSKTDQKVLLLDYVQFQHDSNPALFYKGKERLSLENVPIWGSEFTRFINNTVEFNNTTSFDTDFDMSGIDDLLDDYIETEY